jgi:hypothetical protein
MAYRSSVTAGHATDIERGSRGCRSIGAIAGGAERVQGRVEVLVDWLLGQRDVQTESVTGTRTGNEIAFPIAIGNEKSCSGGHFGNLTGKVTGNPEVHDRRGARDPGSGFSGASRQLATSGPLVPSTRSPRNPRSTSIRSERR